MTQSEIPCEEDYDMYLYVGSNLEGFFQDPSALPDGLKFMSYKEETQVPRGEPLRGAQTKMQPKTALSNHCISDSQPGVSQYVSRFIF